MSANSNPLSAVIVLHIVPNLAFFLKVVNHASNVSFTSQAYTDGQRNATYSLLLCSNNVTNTLSVLSFVPRTVSNSQ